MGSDPKLFVVSGPSGAGKGTLVAGLLKRVPYLSRSVSATTRPIRSGEIDHVHYHFLSKEEFERRLSQGDFLEWAVVHGYLYGTLKEEISKRLAKGEDVVLELDIQGAHAIKERMPESILIFIEPPSLEDLKERLKRRNTETEAQMAQRLEDAINELKVAGKYDYVIINDEISRAVSELVRIVEEERQR